MKKTEGSQGMQREKAHKYQLRPEEDLLSNKNPSSLIQSTLETDLERKQKRGAQANNFRVLGIRQHYGIITR